ncbi:MAG: hypothetical protein ACYS80_25950, partial [Planctomycetota bacterium]
MRHWETKIIGKMLALQVLLLFCVVVEADGSSVTLSIGEPSVPPVVGGTFETTIDYSSDYIIVGAYHVKLHYNPNVI